MRGALVSTVCFIVAASAARGATDIETERAAVERWLQDAWNESATDLIIPDIAVTYQVEYHEIPIPQEMDRLRRVIRQFPQHPDRRKFEVFANRLANGPDIVEQTMYLSMEGSWRLSRYPTGHEHQVDYAVAPRHAWIMSEDQLTIDLPTQLPGSDHDLRTEYEEFARELEIALLGGLSLARNLEMSLGPIEQAGPEWTVRAAAPGLAAMRFWVRWDPALGVARPIRTELEVEDSPSEHNQKWEFSDWIIDPVLGRPVARRVQRFTSDGRLEVVRVIHSIAAIDHHEVDRLCEVPGPSTVDPIRGPVTFRAIADHRPSKPILALVTDTRGSGTATGGTAPATPRALGRSAGIGLVVGSALIGIVGAAMSIRARMRLSATKPED